MNRKSVPHNAFIKIMKLFYPLILLILPLTSCSQSLFVQDEILYGNIENVENYLDENLDHQEDLSNHNAVWMLLDRAYLRFQKNENNGAIQDFCRALESIDYYMTKPLDEALLQIAFSDSMEAYAGSDYEQELTRLYLACCLLHGEDTSNAFAVLQQLEFFQQRKRDFYINNPFTNTIDVHDNRVGKLLLAILAAKNGDQSNSKILLESIGESYSIPVQKTSLVILYHCGKAPYKISTTSPASQANALALEWLLKTTHKQTAICSLPGIQVPYFISTSFCPSSIPILIDQEKILSKPWIDIQKLCIQENEKKRPLIVARAVARLLLRRAAVSAMQEKNPLLGTCMDIGMLLANAQTQADTRSWHFLPASIDLTYKELEPGIHEIAFSNGEVFKLNLVANSLCLINVFYQTPQQFNILIPKRYL